MAAQLYTDIAPPDVLLDRALVAKGGLRQFMRQAFAQVEPARYVSGWHLDAIAEHLEAVLRADLRNLIISVPPGTSKSLSVAVFFPAYAWILDAGLKFIYASYSGDLTRRDAIRSRDLIMGDWYRARWGHAVNIPYQNTRSATFYENDSKGFRYSTSVGGAVTGRHGDVLVVDDPNKAQAATGGAAATGKALDAAIDFWEGTMSTRQANPQTTRKVVIMQRLAENDLTGHLLESGDYEQLCLPMEYDPGRRCVTSIGFADPRTEEGDLLWPERYGRQEVATLVKAMGGPDSPAAKAQLQQDPAPAGGSIIKAAWLNHVWQALPANGRIVQSWDLSFKGEVTSDYVAGQVWLASGSSYYLVDEYHARADFPTAVQAIRDMKARYPRTTAILIEDAANGPAVISTLQKEIPGIVAVKPQGGKEARLNGVAAYFQAGNVLLPQAQACPWIGEYRAEITKFPRAKHDDRVDATSQALLYLAGHSGDRIRAAMDAMKKRR